MRIMTKLPMDDLNKVGPAAREIEAAGYDGVMTVESAHHPFLPLAVAAVETERVELLTSVAIAFPRSPMVCANAAWDLQVASKGRFVLGLGSQIRAHNVRRFSVPWSAPAARMREYVESLRAIWRAWQSGEKLDYQGEHYPVQPHDARFHAVLGWSAHGARHHCGGGAGHAESGRKPLRRRAIAPVLYEGVFRGVLPAKAHGRVWGERDHARELRDHGRGLRRHRSR